MPSPPQQRAFSRPLTKPRGFRSAGLGSVHVPVREGSRALEGLEGQAKRFIATLQAGKKGSVHTILKTVFKVTGTLKGPERLPKVPLALSSCYPSYLAWYPLRYLAWCPSLACLEPFPA
eukprot:3116288-Rhodomonas_salina.1